MSDAERERLEQTARDERERLREWHEATLPIIAALAVYGERANLAALAAKARALNEAELEAQGLGETDETRA